jgi:hypothetical protein
MVMKKTNINFSDQIYYCFLLLSQLPLPRKLDIKFPAIRNYPSPRAIDLDRWEEEEALVQVVQFVDRTEGIFIPFSDGDLRG